jgi:nicotinamide phosphoribosyltransferase
MSFSTTTKVEYPDGTVQTTETVGTARSKWAPIFDDNIIMLTDSYKLSHFKQYPPGTEYVYSYFESRGGKWDSVVFFGLQYFMKRYLSGPVVTEEKIAQAKEYCTAHMTQPGVEGSGEAAFNEAGWRYVLENHGGVLPIKISAVPEGTIVPNKNVLFTMENTDPKAFWLTNYLETLLVQIWHPMTVRDLPLALAAPKQRHVALRTPTSLGHVAVV